MTNWKWREKIKWKMEWSRIGKTKAFLILLVSALSRSVWMTESDSDMRWERRDVQREGEMSQESYSFL